MTEPASYAWDVEQETAIPVGDGHHGAQHVAHRFLNWFSGVSTAISLSPFVLSALDVGKVREVRQTVDFNGACCSIIASKQPLWKAGNYSFTSIPAGQVFAGLDGEHRGIQGNTYGIAGMLSHLFLKTPGVGYHLGTGALPESLNAQLRTLPRGEYLSELKLANGLAAGGIILLGELFGSALEKWEQRRAARHAEENGEDVEAARAAAGKTGRAVSTAGKGFGLFIALPTILAGVGHAIQITTATFGLDNVSDISKPEGIGGHIMAFLGKPMGECGGQFKAPTGAATAGLVGVCCAVPAALGTLALLLSRRDKSSHHQQAIPMIDTRKSPAELSPLTDNLGDVVNHHHSIPWDRFEREAQEVTARTERLEREVARKEKMGSAVKWGMRLATVAGVAAGGYWLQKRSATTTPADVDTHNAQAKLDAFDAADKSIAPKLMTNRAPGATTPPLIGEAGTEDMTTAFREQMKDLPPKAVFRKINEERVAAMGESGGTIPGCCMNAKSGCCGTPYYRGDVTTGLYSALKDVLVKLPQAGQSASHGNRQLAFAGVAATGAGAFFELANRVEQRIAAKPKRELEALRTRHNVLQGVIGHMNREVLNGDKDGGHSGHSR